MADFWKRAARWEKTTRCLLLVLLLYLLPSLQALLPVDDPDIWWHLRTGQWIVEHGWVPLQDPFSTYGSGKTWIAYSWLFETLVYGLHRAFGLVGIVWFTVGMSLLIALALHAWVRRSRMPFVAEVGLLALALSSVKPVLTPRPWLFSMLFYVVELSVIFSFNQSRKLSVLAWLLPLFVLWANLHIQFFYGLAVFGLFVVATVSEQALSRAPTLSPSQPMPVRGVVIMFVMACAATLINPYHYRLMGPVLEYMLQTAVFQNIEELHPLFFRSPADWFVLTLTMAATYALGWQRKLHVFPLLLLTMGALLSFRARRDAWVVVFAATAIVSRFQPEFLRGESFRLTRLRLLCLVVALVVSLYLVSRHREISEPHLKSVVETLFPVRAVGFIKEKRYPGPLYNHLDWGGFLIWSLPELPVSMDGRTNLHGDQRIERSLSAWAGYPGWESDSDLVGARLVVADKHRPLTALLHRDSRFELVYEDTISVVFVRVTENTQRK